jgi:hypothetical protein
MHRRSANKLVSLILTLVVSVVGVKSCSSLSASSPANPANVTKNFLSGLCADQEAAQAAGGGNTGGSPGVTVMSPQEQQQLAQSDGQAWAAFSQEAGPGAMTCPTTTTTP